MAFSESLDFGNSTFMQLVSHEKRALGCIEENSGDTKTTLDAIDKSPTAKTDTTIFTRTLSRLDDDDSLSLERSRRHQFRRSKSDSILPLQKNLNSQTAITANNYSEFFRNDMTFSCERILQNAEDSDLPKMQEERSKKVIKDSHETFLYALDETIFSDDVGISMEMKKNVVDKVQKRSSLFRPFDSELNILDEVVVLDESSFLCPAFDDVTTKQIKNELECSRSVVEEIEEVELVVLPKCSMISRTETFAYKSKSSSANGSENFQKINDNNLSEVKSSKALTNDIVTRTTINRKNISAWNLPASVLHEYEKKGVVEMFDWQIDCLSNPKILFDNCNLVYSAPTSAGKTLVSEILILKTVLERGKKVLLILPFISVVREKMVYLQDLLTAAGYRVEGFFGGYTPPGGFESIDVAICTIEKANAIVNKLLDQGKLDDVGTVVVDEAHLISDPNRGYILELLLSKILYMSWKYSFRIQLIAMSATLTNIELLREWLNAEIFITDFRPVALQEMIKIGSKIYDVQMRLIRDINKPEAYGSDNIWSKLQNDQDHIARLCLETVLEGLSVIVFCPSKDWCEKLAMQLASAIHTVGRNDSEISVRLRAQFNGDAIESVKKRLRDISTGLDAVLEKTITYACAFHHAGLTTEERDIIECSFKSGALKIIVATSTLSSGVNLPARRVLIRTPLFGGKPMNSLTYKQMIGRAGRTGKDILGESILICSESNARIGQNLISAELQPISSCLELNCHTHLKRALLEVIAAGVVCTMKDIHRFVNYTLLSAQKRRKCAKSTSSSENDTTEYINDALNFLLEYEFVRVQAKEVTEDLNYMATRLGLACLASSMPPSDGLILFSELQKSRRCFVLESELHAVYLVTPYSVCYQLQELDWLLFLDLWEKLSPAMRKVGELVGVKESFVVRAMCKQTKLDYKLMQIHKRFYIALALQELVNEVPINDVASKYKCTRGLLQSLQQMSSTFAGIVTAFCNSLRWSTLALIVNQFKERLYFGVHHDLIDLMRLPDLNQKRARILFDAGIMTLVELAQTDPYLVERVLHNALSFDSDKQHDNENATEAEQRKRRRKVFVTGRAELTVAEAAKLLVEAARLFVQHELGAGGIKWAQHAKQKDQNNSVEEKLYTIDEKNVINKQRKNIQHAKDKTFFDNEKSTIVRLLNSQKSKMEISTMQKSNYNVNENNNKSEFFNSNEEKKISAKQKKKFQKNCNAESCTTLAMSDTEQGIKREFTPRRSPRNHASTKTTSIYVPEKSMICLKDTVSLSWFKKPALVNSPTLSRNNEDEIPSSQNMYDKVENGEQCTHTMSSLRSQRDYRHLNSPRFRLKSDIVPNITQEIITHENVIAKVDINEVSNASFELSDLSMKNSLVRKPTTLNASHILDCSKTARDASSFKCLEIVNICGNKELFECTFKDLMAAKRFGFSLGLEQQQVQRKPQIGANLLFDRTDLHTADLKSKCKIMFPINDEFFLAGMAFSISENIVFYMSMKEEDTHANINSRMKFEYLNMLLGNAEHTLLTFDAKDQLKMLHNAIPQLMETSVGLEDCKVANWLLQPDKMPTLMHMAQQFAPECTSLVKLCGSGRGHSSFGLDAHSGILAKIRSSIEACVVVHILRSQLENLQRIGMGQLHKFFCELEMPLQLSLSKMEMIGFPVSEQALRNLFNRMLEIMKRIELKVYELHGNRFNLCSSAAVAKVLGLHCKGNGHLSTAKHILEKIDTPISELIVAYRKLNVALTKNIQPLLKCVRNGRIHGQSITYTATGRISMSEPNLQNVAKDFSVDLGSEKITISCRSVFMPNDGRVCLVSADFCQLEMRILAHLSQDAALLRAIKTPSDIFSAIAAHWNKLPEDDISEQLRNGTKQICYGIVYGMGMRSLADSLKCTEQEASLVSQQFHTAYPGIRGRLYTEKVIRFARNNGYVETIMGRRRYLEHINSEVQHIKNQAERQAINSTVQGSAADITKNAIIRMERNITKYREKMGISESQSVRLVLHLHDELLYEVPEEKAKKVAKLLRVTMENCVSLNVPLKVKLKIGRSWAELKEVQL